MSSYRIYCNECDEEFILEMSSSKQPEYCCLCGSEVIYGDIVNTSNEDLDDDDELWNKIAMESYDDIEDWKRSE